MSRCSSGVLIQKRILRFELFYSIGGICGDERFGVSINARWWLRWRPCLACDAQRGCGKDLMLRLYRSSSCFDVIPMVDSKAL